MKSRENAHGIVKMYVLSGFWGIGGGVSCENKYGILRLKGL